MTRALVATIVLALSAAAAAQPDERARAEAEKLTVEGARAYGRGDYAAALEQFRKSYEVFPSPNTRSNLARALLKLGRLPEAMEEFETFLAEANNASDAAHEFALAQKIALASQLGKLVIDADADGAAVAIDGKPSGVTPLQRARYVSPGAHMVTVTAAGHPPFRAEVKLGPGELREIHATLGAAPSSSTTVPPPPVETAPAPPRPRTPPRERSGRFMANLKLGLSPLVFFSEGNPASLPIYFTFSAELGVALCCHKQLYVLFPFSLSYKDFGNGSSTVVLEVPIGVQYDVRLFDALYLVTQLSVGYAVVLPSAPGPVDNTHAAVIRPAAGLKYVIAGRGNVGIDLFSLPILIALSGNTGAVLLEYRLMFYGGVNF